MIDLEPIKARVSAASKGPWRSMSAGNSTMEDGLLDHIAEVQGLQRPWEPTWVGWSNLFRTFMRRRDADFVANARTDVPALIAEIEMLRATIAPSDSVKASTTAEPVRPVGCPARFYDGLTPEQGLQVTRAFFAGMSAASMTARCAGCGADISLTHTCFPVLAPPPSSAPK